MPKTISKDLPLSEITLRRYEKPYATNKRELTRKLCLSLGLLQPGDSISLYDYMVSGVTISIAHTTASGISVMATY